MTDGVHNVDIQRDFGAIPGVHDGDSRVVNVKVHKLPTAFTQNVVINQAENGMAFVGLNSSFEIAAIGELGLIGATFSGVESGGLAGSGVSYSAAGAFSLDSGALSSTGILGTITVNVNANNVRGTHQLIVLVEAVDILPIPAEFLVQGGDREAAILDGTRGRVTDLTPQTVDGGKVRVEYTTATDGASVTPAGQVALTAPLGSSEDSKVVAVEIVHTPQGNFGQDVDFPNPNQKGYPTMAVNINVTVWKLDAPAAQDKSTNSIPTTDPRDPENVAATFDLPANPAGSGIDFATGGTWSAVGTPDEELVVAENGEVKGTPKTEDDSVSDEYTINLTASFMHPSLGSALDIVMNLLVVDFTAPATIVLSPGANGQLIAYVNGSSLTANANSEVTVASKTEVEVVAIPAPGYRVSEWTEPGADTAGCASDGANPGDVGHGGRKSCIFTAGNDKDYDIAVAFVAGAIAVDLAAIAGANLTADQPFVLPNLGAGQDPADLAVLRDICLAFGGSLTGSGATESCSGHNEDGVSCAFIDTFTPTFAAGSCQSGGYANALACNLQNMKAKDNGETCADACSSGEVAVGGSCIVPSDSQVVYSQPSNGSMSAFRAYGGNRINSGENVPMGALLSLRAVPNGDNYVSAWDNCVPTADGIGGFTDKTAKSCIVRASVAVMNVGVSLAAVPSSFSNYPANLLTGDVAGTNANCEALGGTVISFGPAAIPGCQSVTETGGIRCLHQDPSAGNQNSCGPLLTHARNCNLLGLKPQDRNVCGMACPPGEYALGSTCKSGALFSAQSLKVLSDAGVAVSPAVLESSDIDDFFFRAAVDSVDGVSRERFYPRWNGVALPDIVDPDLTQTGGNVEDTAANCEALGGTAVSAPGSVSGANPPAYCVGAAENAFCVIEDLSGFFPCFGTVEGALFNHVRDCNDIENKPALDNTSCATNACPEGLTARGSECIVTEPSGEPVTTPLAKGVESDDLTFDSNDNVEDTAANCEALGGTPVSAPGSVSGANPPAYCVGAAENAFCVIEDLSGFFPCFGTVEGALFNHVLNCNRQNMTALDNTSCGAMCQNGLAALGAECVAPPEATDGLFIETPSGGGQLTVTDLSVGVLNENIAAGMYTVNAQPDAGYHVSKWLGNCAGKGEASPYRPSPQSCVLEKKDDEGLVAGVEFKRGLLHPNVLPVLTATIITSPTEAICNGFGGTQQVTLGTGNSGVTYCNGFNQDDANRAPEDENIEDQCWISGGDFIGDDSSADTSVDGNIQRCSRAFVVARECNKRNMRSASILPQPAPDSAECDGSLDTCAPQSFARAQNQPSNELLCGDPCEADEIAFGGKCVTEASAAAGTWVVVE